MSRADDTSLLAMQAARMSLSSIAVTMGWSEGRVSKRLRLLNGWSEAAAAVEDLAEDDDSAADDEFEPEDLLAKEPLIDGHALIVRTFQLYAGGYGAAAMLADRRTVFIATGRKPLALGDRPAVELRGEAWCIAGAPANG